MHKTSPLSIGILLLAGLVSGWSTISHATTSSAVTPSPTPVTTAQSITTIANDSFRRTNSTGLGTADFGGQWSSKLGHNMTAVVTKSGGATFANIKPGSSTEAYLSNATAVDTTISGVYSLPSLGSTALVYQGYEARRQPDGSAYLAKVSWDASGALIISFSRRKGAVETLMNSARLSTKISAEHEIAVDFTVSGTTAVTLQARAYPAGTAAPPWQLSEDDSSPSRLTSVGTVGIWDYVPQSSQPVTITQHSFVAFGSTPDSSAYPPVAPSATATPVTPPPAEAVGSLPVGSATYTVPSGALFVSSGAGSDSGDGSVGSPFKTIAMAINSVHSDGTIILRAGNYHEEINTSKSNFTIQSYPGEAAWLNGTSRVTGFAAKGSGFITPWFTQFSHSSSFSRGDTTPPGGGGISWGFVNTAHPMAAWPDQVFVDGTQQVQVVSNPALGQFAVDYASHTLALGSNPAGHVISADTLERAFVVSGANVVLRGIGVTGYASQLCDMGTVFMHGLGDSIENVVIDSPPTQGLSMDNTNQRVNKVTITNPGMTGIHANRAYGLVITNVLVTGTNWEHFNPAPASAGMKLTNLTDVTISDSTITGSYDSNGIWLDDNVVRFTITGNQISRTGPTSSGIDLELSGSGVVANNTVTDNKYGVSVRDTANTDIYNNNFANSSFASMDLWQDNRYKVGMPQMTITPTTEAPWLVTNINVINNIFAANTAPWGFQFYAKDDETNRTASSMNITIAGNLFHTKNGDTSTDRMVAWGAGDNKSWTEYPTPNALNAGLGKTWNNSQVPGQPGLSVMRSLANSANAMPLPLKIASAVGQPPGLRHIGSF
jgi:parallel beta-helix repeat protein